MPKTSPISGCSTSLPLAVRQDLHRSGHSMRRRARPPALGLARLLLSEVQSFLLQRDRQNLTHIYLRLRRVLQCNSWLGIGFSPPLRTLERSSGAKGRFPPKFEAEMPSPFASSSSA